jgi:hypothetical protein
MTAQVKEWSPFSVNEWNRLNLLSGKYETKLKTAYSQTVVRGNRPNGLEIRNVITDAVLETCIETAHVYRLVFNPNSPVYRTMIDRLTDQYIKVVDSDKSREKVKELLPRNLSLVERRNRLDVFGLDARSAILLEKMRQEGKSQEEVWRERLRLAVQRGNLIALTETNRIINTALEGLWIDNFSVVSKADIWYFDESISRDIQDVAQLPKRAKKEIITRRDDRVCHYCDPLDGLKVRLGAEFETEHGFFQTPPFHPRCRCFLIVSL